MNPRTKGALVIGSALVFAALLVNSYQTPRQARDLQPAVVEAPTFMATSPLRENIPVTDSDGDGVPDWQELLNDTEPLTLPTASGTSYEPPNTLTDEFARDFFETYVRNEGFGAFARNPEELITEASLELVTETADALLSERDITIVPGDAATVSTYANTVATIIDSARLPEGTPNELEIVEEALAQSNSDNLTRLNPIIENYDAIINGVQQTPVPEAMVKQHLDLLNTLTAVRNDIAMMQQLFADPLAALVRIQRYQDDIRGLGVAIVNLFERAAREGAGFSPGDPVYRVYSFQ